MPVTPLFAAILAIVYICLSVGVIKQRLGKNISIGSAGDTELEKVMRIHANFAEYVPISLILMWFIEIITYSSSLVFILGCVLLVSRLAHVIGLNDTANKMMYRRVGMIGTFAVILISSIVLIWHYVPI